MAKQANSQPITKLSELIRDPFVRAAFKRAERDDGDAFAIPSKAPHGPTPAHASATPIPAR
jgi:hypothetical protein